MVRYGVGPEGGRRSSSGRLHGSVGGMLPVSGGRSPGGSAAVAPDGPCAEGSGAGGAEGGGGVDGSGP